MLWQKDSDGVYKQLFQDNYQFDSHQMFVLNKKKNNKDSLRARLDGNQLYASNDFEGAFFKYNLSICLADDSEHLSLAYSNRAQCFLKMNFLEFCIIDNNAAKDAGFPTDKISKLETRERECLKKMSGRVIAEIPTLKQEENFEHPNDAIQIKQDNVYGRMITATRDIKIGEVVLTEEMYIRSSTSIGYDCCSKCYKKFDNFFPCNNCAGAMYCSNICADTSSHDCECDITIATTDDVDELAFTIRSIITAIKSFTTVEELITFVENPTTSTESKYSKFFHLSSGVVSSQRVLDCVERGQLIFHAIMSSSKLKKNFQTTRTKRFLEHLVIQHYLILSTNSFGNQTNGISVRQISLQASYINHSCLPNIVKLSKGNISMCRAVLPIRRGDQLFLTYIEKNVFSMTGKERNDQLEKSYGFRCRCLLCKKGPLQANELETDEHFVYVAVNAGRAEQKFDISLVRSLIKHCIEFINKYSSMMGSQELYYIADTLGAVFSKELNELRN